MDQKIRFPLVSVGVFLCVAALSLLVWQVSESHCAFGFGGFQCNGWASGWSGFLFAWSLLALVLVPGALGVAVWRMVRWYRSG
ncbi:MAG: hypothetical protein QM569_10040 [Acidovorax sp.]|uniref:hypothetical protein n=1 Tax=Acidovorax sp. TaxID=1872122 RepID=UPI0039E5A67A